MIAHTVLRITPELTLARSSVSDFDVLLHAASEQSQLARRPVRLSVTAAGRTAAAGLVAVDAADHHRLAYASWTTRVGHTRRTVLAVQIGARRWR